MRDNMTNKEEAQLLKQWFNDYGKPVIIAVIIGLGLGYAWRYYNQVQAGRDQAASTLYQSVLLGEQSHQDTKALAKVNSELVSKYAKTPYATLSQFLMAKIAVENNNEKAAYSALNWVVKNTKLDSFKQLADIRLARLYLNDKKPQQALAQVKTTVDKAYMPMLDSVRGDAYYALGEKAKANSAYKNALAQYALLGVDNPILKLKLSR